SAAIAGIVRSKTDPATLMKSIRKELATFEPDRAIGSEKLMTDAIGASNDITYRRFLLNVLAGFAGAALILSIVGGYGVASYLVRQRTKEIGVRMALGARRGAILAGTLTEGATLTAIGVVLGLGGAAALSRLMVSLLFGVSPIDLPT